MGERIEGAEIRRVRVALDFDQTRFGKNFGAHRRSVIRWEKAGHYFDSYIPWREQGKPNVKPALAIFQDLAGKAAVKEAAARAVQVRAKKLASRKNPPVRTRRPKPKKRTRRLAGVKRGTRRARR